MIKNIIIFFQTHVVDLSLTLGAILFTCGLHWTGVFDFLELKTYDYRFHTVRGPLTGWRASDSTIINMGTDVVLVEVDDEAWRILKDNKVPWPYPRGDIWARAVDNISKAGAKVIAFDIQFDSPDARSEYLRSVSGNLPSDFQQYLPGHGDILLAESIQNAQDNGTKVVMDVKMVREPTRIPPSYIAYPVPEIMDVNPETGLINDMLDTDGFSRQYSIAGYMEHEPDIAYLTLGVKCVKAFLDIPDDAVPTFNADNLSWNFGDLNITSYGRTNNFLVNYYGPPSGYKIPGGKNLKPWGTFPRFSLSQILDTQDYDLPEDLDWMSQFIPGEIPDWILSIEDEAERNDMMAMMGLGADFDITQSPFYNKIVILGVAIEVLHDVKSTPFYNYMDLSQLTPGMETHANAIQTILHENYIKVFGGKTTRYMVEGAPYPMVNFLLIFCLCTLAYILLTKIELHPIVAGIIIFSEGLVYYAFAMGMFANDNWWFWKSSVASLLPGGLHEKYYEHLQVVLPGPGESYMMPIVAPLVGLVLTYASNIIFQFLHEQQDKKFLRETFGTYIAPKVLDKMYEEKQAPKLGGVEGHHTAFFSDIQNFSTFSEALEPTRMVALMNEYLTVMSQVILDNEGTLDKYIGDAIVAFYGAPAPVENHEKKSCTTALLMEDALEDLRQKWRRENDWPDIVYSMQHRIGLNCGKMVTGNMGSEMRMNYTMMGDTVNLAARLESSAKQYGVYNFVGENIYEETKDEFIFRFLDFVQVKGKNIPVKVYELVSAKDNADNHTVNLIKVFEEGLDHYYQQQWDKALAHFKKAEGMEDHFTSRNTTPSAVFIERCTMFKDNPPGKDWDGVWTMTSK
ncbi:MAG: adenylate/guanylate cyclase domain-containing protein [Candidatus Neomarinimicrobiota bacterium]|nr:adenylate/guanylate cyclase domain-containing protein [Candidatus Neomarinimicrobiota bacterium]